MNVTLYTTADDVNVMNKTLSAVTNTPITCNPTGDCNNENPVIILAYNASYLNANYAYIDTFGYYYYITEKTLLTGGRIRLTLAVDALYTCRSQIANCKCLAIRSESEGKPSAVVDNMLPINPNRQEILSILFDKKPFFDGSNPTITQSARCWVLQTM